MTNNYDPTTAPGETRTRARYIGIENRHARLPMVRVLEQVVIQLADGAEKILEDTNGFSVTVTPEELATEFPLRDPETDDIIEGQTSSAAAVMALVYSWTRAKQIARDEAATPVDPVDEPA